MAGPQKQMSTMNNGLDDSLLDSAEQSISQSDAKQHLSNTKHAISRSPHDGDSARDALLQKELASVRKVNEAIEGVLQNLERAKSNMTVRVPTFDLRL